MKKYFFQIDVGYFEDRYANWYEMAPKEREVLINDFAAALSELGRQDGFGFIANIIQDFDLSGRIRIFDLGENFEVEKVEILPAQIT